MFSRWFKGRKDRRGSDASAARAKRPGRDQLGHADADIRLGALAAITEPTETELRTITSLISEDPDIRVRRRAVELCRDTVLLLQMLDDEELEEAAAARLVALNPDQIASGNLGGRHPALIRALLALGRLPQDRALLGEDPDHLIEFVIVSRGDAQRELLEHGAFRRADHLTALERASRDKAKSVNRFARDRLETLKQQRARSADLDQRLQELLTSLAKHLTSDPAAPGFQDKHSQLRERLEHTMTELEAVLAVLAEAGEEPVSLAQRREQISQLPTPQAPQPPAAIEAAVETAAETGAETGAAFAALTDELARWREEMRAGVTPEALQTTAQSLDTRWQQVCQSSSPDPAQQQAYDTAMAECRALADACERLEQLRSEQAATITGPEPPAQREAAEAYWRDVAAGRSWLKTVARLRSRLNWPDWAPSPPLLDELAQQIGTLETRLEAAETFRRDEEKKLEAQLDALTRHIEAGETQAAQQLLGEARKLLDRLPQMSAGKFNKSLNRAAARLGELKDWQTFVTSPKRQTLCEAMENLSTSPLAPPDQAARIKDLRRQWNQLGPAAHADDRALAEAFNAAAEKAFEPCREYFAEQTRIRDANLAARQQICDQLQAYLDEGNWDQPDIRAAEQILRTARSEWQQFFPVDRKAGKPVEARFESLQQTLHAHIRREWDRNLAAKQQIVTDARALLDADSPISGRIDGAKALQQRWREIGPTPRRPDQKLWQEFRAICDQIFAIRDAEKADAEAALAADEKSYRALLEEFESALGAADSQTVGLQEFQNRFQALPRLPERSQRSFDRRFAELEQSWRAQRQQQVRAEKLARMEALLAEDARGSTDPAAVTADELRHLVVLAEIAADIDSAPEDRELRMTVQVDLMNQGGRQALITDPHELVDQWLAHGAKPAGIENLQQRFSAAVRALANR